MNFSLADFRALDLPNLLINIWSFSDYAHKNCLICNQYQPWCIEAAGEKWSLNFKDFDYVINNIKIQNISWFDVGKLSSASKDAICDVICKWHVKCRVTAHPATRRRSDVITTSLCTFQ